MGSSGASPTSTGTIGGVDMATQTELNALSAATAPISAIPRGNLTVFLGDSTTLASDGPATQVLGESWPVYLAMVSGQRFRYVRNAGVAGDTSTQMLARFDTAVTPYSPNIVTILAGINDIAQGVVLTTFQANIIAMVAKCLAINARPVLATITPNSSGAPTNTKEQVQRFNSWLKRYAAQQKIDILDFYSVLVDPTNGSYLSAYNADGVHPSTAGMMAMAVHANAVLGPLLPYAPPVLCQDDNDENSLLYKGLFTGYSGAGLPTSWFDNAGAGTSVLSYTTDAAVPGQLLTITSSASAARQIALSVNMGTTTMPATIAGATTFSLAVNPYTRGVLFIGTGATFEIAKVSSVTGSGPYNVTLTRGLAFAHSAGEAVVVNGAVGDTLVYSGLVTCDGGVTVSAGLLFTGATGVKAMSVLSRPMTRAIFRQEFLIPVGATIMQPYVQVAAGSGVTSFGQLGLYNVTRMGIA